MDQLTLENVKQSLTLPIIMAPMFLVSNPTMVVKACEAGIIGSFPALNARTNADLEEWMKTIHFELKKIRMEHPNKKVAPWAINFIAHRTNKRFHEDLALINTYKPPIVITSLGDPSPVADIVHRYGGLVFSDVINVKFAQKAIEKGSDGLILVCNGAGGHGGILNPISFLHEVREFWEGPVVLAGGLSKGEDVLAAEILGADFVYMGTRFISSLESDAAEKYKEMVISSTIDDILYTDAFSGVNGNYLVPSIVEAGLDPERLRKKEEINFNELANPELKAWKDVWSAGQGVGQIKETESIHDIIQKLTQSYEEAKGKIVLK
jgi:nitronate monooxygenase